MIPQFPEFKKIEISDQGEINEFVKNFPVYSDFNFVSLYCWDVDNKRQISMLNGNLVLIITDDITGKKFITFLGTNAIEDTAEKLFAFARKKRMRRVFKMIPQETVNFFSTMHPEVEIREDRDNFDYIYSVDELSKLDGGKYSRQRRLAKRFESSYGNSMRIEKIELSDGDGLEAVSHIFRKWNSIKESYSKREELALQKLFQSADNFNLTNLAVFVDEKPVGFLIMQICNEETAISHFGKADYSYTGIFPFLVRESAKLIKEHGCSFFNFEEDLGLGQIRLMKEQYRPISFMRKYTVELKESFWRRLLSVL